MERGEGRGVNDLAADTSFQYWGKSREQAGARYHALPYHSLDVAAVLDAILERDPVRLDRLAAILGLERESTRRLLIFAAAMHDLGKFARSFQVKDEELFATLHPGVSPIPGRMHHSTSGADLWRLHVQPRVMAQMGIQDKRKRMKTESILKVLLGPAFGHHGMPVESKAQMLDNADFVPATLAAVDALVDRLRELFLKDEGLPTPTGDLASLRLASWELAGLFVMADWLGSDTTYFRYRAEGGDLRQYWEDVARPKASQAVSASGVLPVQVFDRGVALVDFGVKGEPTAMQQACLDLDVQEPSLVIIEDVTGGGKTEAALMLAHRFMRAGHARGLYMGLPTMASADAIYDRVGPVYRKMYDPNADPSLALAHSRAHLKDLFRALRLEGQTGDSAHANEPSVTAECSAWIADSRKKALLAQMGIGSVDQAILTALPVKHQSDRKSVV